MPKTTQQLNRFFKEKGYQNKKLYDLLNLLDFWAEVQKTKNIDDYDLLLDVFQDTCNLTDEERNIVNDYLLF